MHKRFQTTKELVCTGSLSFPTVALCSHAACSAFQYALMAFPVIGFSGRELTFFINPWSTLSFNQSLVKIKHRLSFSACYLHGKLFPSQWNYTLFDIDLLYTVESAYDLRRSFLLKLLYVLPAQLPSRVSRFSGLLCTVLPHLMNSTYKSLYRNIYKEGFKSSFPSA